MKKAEFMNSITRSFHKAKFKVSKHSPEILIVAGVVGTITSAVMACKATLKVNDILEDTKETLDKIHDGVEKGKKTKDGEVYTAELAKKDITLTYVQTGYKFVKLYGPSIVLGGLSLTAIVTSNNILRQRNMALAAAYSAVDKSFKDYRGRVVERFGKDLDRELRYNIKAKEIEETVTDENGKEKTVKKTVNSMDPNDISLYARFYDDGNVGWSKNAEHNLYFLKQQQAWANKMLKERGYLFLNEVYDMLGYARTDYGQVVGWIFDEKNPVGDNFVDFGIYNQDNERARLFVNGEENVILLDFNVDGNILEFMA